MKISMIAAIGQNRVIGKNNGLVWSLPDDMKFFMRKTTGHPVIMGRKNYESIPEKFRPLPNRKNIIITRQSDYNAERAFVVHSLEEAINSVKEDNPDEIFIIGGGQVYEMGLAVADTMYITEIHEAFDGDTYFPEYDKSQWEEVERISHGTDERHAYAFDFATYQRKT